MNIFLHSSFAYRVLNKLCIILSKNTTTKKLFNPLIRYWREIKGLRIIDDSFVRYVKLKKKGLEQHKGDITTVALRGSYVDYGYYASEGSYNLGLTSSDLYSSFWIYESQLRYLPKLKNCVLYYSVFCPGFELIKTVEKYRQLVYSKIFEYNLPDSITLNPKHVSYVLKCIDKADNVNCDISYYGYQRKSDFAETPASVRVAHHLRENIREPDQLKWLELLADEIDKDRRRLFIVLPPYRSDYKKLLPAKSIIYKKLFSINFPSSTVIVDFHDSEIFNDSDFGDTDHLNEQGAKKITSELNLSFIFK